MPLQQLQTRICLLPLWPCLQPAQCNRVGRSLHLIDHMAHASSWRGSENESQCLHRTADTMHDRTLLLRSGSPQTDCSL